MVMDKAKIIPSSKVLLSPNKGNLNTSKEVM
jgi:hypothetical protein